MKTLGGEASKFAKEEREWIHIALIILFHGFQREKNTNTNGFVSKWIYIYIYKEERSKRDWEREERNEYIMYLLYYEYNLYKK